MIRKRHDFVLTKKLGSSSHYDYPFRKMLAGESFFVERDDYLLRKLKKALATFESKNPNRTFSIQSVDNGARVWRVR